MHANAPTRTKTNAWPHRTARRLWLVVRDTLEQIRRAQLLQVSSSLAYTTILSIIPLLAVSFAIFQAFGGMDRIYGTIEPFILDNLAEGASDEVLAKIHSFIANAHASALGVGGVIGLVFTSMSMLSSVEKAINRVWGAPMGRTLFQRISSYWLFITLGPLALAVAVGFATSADLPLNRLLPSGTGMFLLMAAGFVVLNKWVPHTKVRWAFAAISGFVTAALWEIGRLVYSLYTRKVVTYDKIYGSLGAVPILLLWIYIAWVIVLTGAALTCALQRRFESESGPQLAR